MTIRYCFRLACLAPLSALPLTPCAQESARAKPAGSLEAPIDALDAWPQWRGPLGTGVAPRATPPLEWSETENLRWKIELPGHGHSTPIVWGDQIYLTTAVPTGDPLDPAPETAPGAHDNTPVTRKQSFVVMAIERSDGSLRWQHAVHEELPHERAHKTASFASPSPITDGEAIFASFGSRGVFALSLDGALLWKADLGDMRAKHEHGEGSSPALYGDSLILNWDHEGQSFLVALDKQSGAERWRAERDAVTSWSSPIVVEVAGQAQVIVAGSERVHAYDLATGEVIWECGGLSHNTVATPVAGDGRVIVASSYEKQAMLAIELEGARGDLTRAENLLWVRRKNTPYVPSLLLHEGLVSFLHHYQGVLSVVDAETGEELGRPTRLTGIRNVYASPVAAGDRSYVTDLDGTTLVLSHGGEPEILAQNQLDDSFSASAALVGRELYLRGSRYLYCIAEDK